MMYFLLLDFHSVGKTSTFCFLSDGAFFQVWPIKQKIALFLFSASVYYRANYILYIIKSIIERY